MKRALFIMLPTKSHYIPCIELAKELTKNGYHIFFAGTASVQDYVEQMGFEFVRFKYMSTYRINSVKAFFGTLIKSLLDQSYKTERYQEFLQSVIDTQQTCATINPDLIFIDEHLSHYYFYLIGSGRKLYLLNTKQSTRKVAGVPPLNSAYVAQNTTRSFLVSELLWQKHLLFKRAVEFFNNVAFLGHSNEQFQRSYIKKLNISAMVTDETSMYDYDSINGVKTIMLVSQKLDYPWRKKLPDELFFNYRNVPTDENLPPYLHWIVGTKAANLPLLYCAVGTFADSEPEPYIQFFTQLIRAFEKRTSYRLLISTGSKSIKARLMNEPIPEHIHLYDRLPQTAILPYCDVMITHGGLNSVKEAIAAGVLMLGIINPAHKYKDTSGNIARLIYHQIGLGCRISSSASDLFRLIDKLIYDPLYKRKSIAFNECICADVDIMSIL